MTRSTAIVAGLAVVVAATVLYVAMGLSDDDTSAAMVFTCGNDATARELPVTREEVVLAGDARFFAPCPGDHDERHREVRQRALVMAATESPDPEIARLAYVAVGRAGVSPLEPHGSLAPFVQRGLTHDSPDVRRAAVTAFADALDGAVREPASVADLLRLRDAGEAARASQGEAARLVSAAVRIRLEAETDPSVAAAMLVTLGRLPYIADEQRAETEAVLIAQVTSGSGEARLGAARGLEFMMRRSPGSTGAETIRVLREVAAPGLGGADGVRNGRDQPTASAAADRLDPDDETAARTRRVALLALTAARDADPPTILAAAADPDWQVRRLAVLRMGAEARGMAEALEAALSDPAFQVRYEAVRLAGRQAARTGRCAAVVGALDDQELPVVLAALDQVPSGCREHASIVERLTSLAGLLSAARDHWHVPARALAALSRVAPEEADTRLAGAAQHPVSQVRAAAADVARALNREDIVVSLMMDDEPNVRAAALRALGRMVSERRFDAALEAVRSDDFDLIRTGAGMLEDVPDPAAAADVLLERLRTLTDEGWDTSRDPRMAIVRRLGALLPAERAAELLPYTADFDARIALAARDAYLELSGASELPADAPAQRARYPRQPTLEQLAALPATATIELDGGVIIELELMPDVAPVLVARFAELATAGHYDGLTIHRIAPNFVIQGGSPGANEYSGVDRYLRDEIGAPNWRGTVGLSTRGRDTGDAQFFVNMVDNPRLDHEYSVFARVTSGMDALDRVLEGARIVSVKTEPGSVLRFP